LTDGCAALTHNYTPERDRACAQLCTKAAAAIQFQYHLSQRVFRHSYRLDYTYLLLKLVIKQTHTETSGFAQEQRIYPGKLTCWQ
jgi:hypothetical protein